MIITTIHKQIKSDILMRATHITKRGFGRLTREGLFCVIIKQLETEGKVLIKTEGNIFFHGNLSDLTEIPNVEIGLTTEPNSLEYIYKLLTYDDMLEDERIFACIEYIENIRNT
jgi:hypothetical protein